MLISGLLYNSKVVYYSVIDVIFPIVFGAFLPFIIILLVRLYKEVRVIQQSPEPNQFIFKQSIWEVLFPILFLISMTLPNWDRIRTIHFIFGVIVLLLVVFRFFSNKLIIVFEKEGLRTNNQRLKVKSANIRAIRISDHEVTFHTAKFPKRHRLYIEKLEGKEWKELQEEVSRYASQFDHIEIERV
ncbi:MAG: hypothetical protein HEP71_34410 [Roseivirga sp.]|nr:hypothetical protein [Roseivirga sp.]